MDDPQKQTTRTVGEIIDFPGTGRVIIQFVQDGQIFFASWQDGCDEPWLARMTFDDFEASVVRTRNRIEADTNSLGEAE